MPIFDVSCERCKKESEVWIKIDEDVPVCPDCGDKRIKLCNCSHFKLVYNNSQDMCSWGNEGYASSQYYRNIKGE